MVTMRARLARFPDRIPIATRARVPSRSTRRIPPWSRRRSRAKRSSATASVSHAKRQRVVVMTEATSGFGPHTVLRFASIPDTRVIIDARGSDRSAPPGVEITAARARGALARDREAQEPTETRERRDG